MKAFRLAVFMSIIMQGAFALSPLPRAELWAANSRRSARLNPSLQKLYNRALELFEEKKFEAAAEMLSQLLGKQNDYGPAKIHLARCLYQLGRHYDAFKLFQQVDADRLEPEASYDAGQTAYLNNNFAAAMIYFRTVPNGHPLYDLAGYYGGIAAFKIEEFENAVKLLEQAVVLPSKLVRTQQLYLREAERMVILKQKQEAAQIASKSGATSNPLSPSPALPAAAIQDNAREISYRFLRPQRSIELQPQLSQQQHTSSSGSSESYAIQSGQAQLNMGFSHEDSAQSAHYLLQVQAAFSAMEGTSREIGLFPDTRREQELYIIGKQAPKTMLLVDTLLGVEWPIRETHTLGLNFGVYSHTPDHYEVDNIYSPWFGAFYAHKNSSVSTMLKAEAHSRFEDSRFLYLTSLQSASFGFKLPAKMQFNVLGELLEYTYDSQEAEAPIDGPELTGRLSGELGFQDEHELALFAGGVYESNRQLRLHDLPEGPVVEFNSQLHGLTARAEVGPWPWLRLGVKGQDITRKISSVKRAEDIVKKYYTPEIRQITAYINLSSTF